MCHVFCVDISLTVCNLRDSFILNIRLRSDSEMIVFYVKGWDFAHEGDTKAHLKNQSPLISSTPT